jgi:hypothetical protein
VHQATAANGKQDASVAPTLLAGLGAKEEAVGQLETTNLPLSGTRAQRAQLTVEIKERVDYLYYCARDMNDKVHAFEKPAPNFIELI